MTQEVKLRARFSRRTSDSSPFSVSTDARDGAAGEDVYPAKEWAVTDDVLNVADSATVSISNEDGANAGKFFLGQRVELDESDPTVANGQWIRHFTGRVTGIRTYTDLSGGSNIMVTMMDLGWHLTSCDVPPLERVNGKLRHRSIRRKTFGQLLEMVLDPSWGFGPIEYDGDKNARLKHGRQVVVQNYNAQPRSLLPLIQIEPGQKPLDVFRHYASREGYLVNVGAGGELVVFRPNYEKQALYSVEVYPSTDANRENNNVIGTPTLSEDIGEVYSDTQVWSTIVIPPPPGSRDAENQNAQYTHGEFTPSENPLPFKRLCCTSDAEAINKQLRENRAKWKWQMGQFNAWTYSVEVQGHSQDGAFFVSNEMVHVFDKINGIPAAAYYVQSVRRSCTLRDGLKTQLTIKKPGLLNPDLETLRYGGKGGGVKRAKTQPVDQEVKT